MGPPLSAAGATLHTLTPTRVLCCALVLCASAAHADTTSSERTGKLSIAITFTGADSWQDPATGAHADLKFSRQLAYTMTLRGTYVARERRVFVARPVAATSPAGRICGRGGASIFDVARGATAGGPGQPALIPFAQQVRGGGPYPGRDESVPQSDLCRTTLTFDESQRTLTLQIDGTDAYVRVVNTHNGHKLPAYNLRLQGDAVDSQSRFTFVQRIPAGALRAEGTKIIAKVSTVSGPGGSAISLNATVRWRVEMQ